MPEWHAYYHWLNPGDNAWQLTAATLVGLMSVPGLAILYGGVMQKRWSVNSMMLTFVAFALVLVAWCLWAFKMGFGLPLNNTVAGHQTFFKDFIGTPGSVLGHIGEQGQASIPLISSGPPFHFPTASLVYFQFVFAAITPILMLGSVLGRINFKAWIPFVLLWITFVYVVNAFLIWGGGYFAHKGALDYSGGYVIHLAAGISGFVAAAVIGPRLQRDREVDAPNNLLMVAAGAGLLWLGWNGFNGGDPYFANADAAAAVLNTNIATAVALLVWLILDMFALGHPSAVSMINGMIVGLVAITPAAGYVDGFGAIATGGVAALVVWFTLNKLGKLAILKRVDDTFSVLHTHGVAGLMGGLCVGLFANPAMIMYLSTDKKVPPVSVTGLFYSGDPSQLWKQFLAALVIIVWNVIATMIVLKIVSFVFPLRASESDVEGGDLAIHGVDPVPPYPLTPPVEPVLR